MTRRYEMWKQRVISQAVSNHRLILPDVLALEDQSLLELYDTVLGILTGPKTMRMRKDPCLLDCWRLRHAQMSFEQALYHEKKIRDLNIRQPQK